jgi:gamma-glutamyl phosphate reductase
MATTTAAVTDTCAAAKRASRVLATLGSGVKDAALEAIAVALLDRTPEILEANGGDLEAGRASGLSPALVDFGLSVCSIAWRSTSDGWRTSPPACGRSRLCPTRSER